MNNFMKITLLHIALFLGLSTTPAIAQESADIHEIVKGTAFQITHIAPVNESSDTQTMKTWADPVTKQGIAKIMSKRPKKMVVKPFLLNKDTGAFVYHLRWNSYILYKNKKYMLRLRACEAEAEAEVTVKGTESYASGELVKNHRSTVAETVANMAGATLDHCIERWTKKDGEMPNMDYNGRFAKKMAKGKPVKTVTRQVPGHAQVIVEYAGGFLRVVYRTKNGTLHSELYSLRPKTNKE